MHFLLSKPPSLAHTHANTHSYCVLFLIMIIHLEGFISMRGRHFKKEIEIIGQWRRNNFSTQGDAFQRNLKEIKPENVFPLFLNLVSCFLFMMNSYIIEPSSAYYAEELGSSDAMAGLMIGAAPLFALFSCIGYSYWTNDNYKSPLLFAGTLQFIGNLLYANALSYRRVELCLIGRAVTGLGAPRVINRRYDYFLRDSLFGLLPSINTF
jgi:hypothetical protein